MLSSLGLRSPGNYSALDMHYATATSFSAVTNESMTYSTELFTTQLVRIIDTHPASTPLFLYAPYEAVHGASSCFVQGRPPNCMRPDGDELQAPPAYIEAQSHIVDHDRRTFGGMLGALDDGVANVTRALEAKGMLSDTIILFSTDNGAPDSHFGSRAMSNFPLRGGKGQLWEGGIRGTGFIWGRGVPRGANVTKLIHASDWLPTFAALAGVHIPESRRLDGYDVWRAITEKDALSPRKEILHNIDPSTGARAVRVGEFKLIIGQNPGGWGPNPSDPTSKKVPAGNSTGPWLFNVRVDVSERVNLHGVDEFKEEQAACYAALARFTASMVPCRLCKAKPDPKAAPKVIKGLNICTPAP